MATLTEGASLGDLIRFEEDTRFSREEATIGGGANLGIGADLGQITASGNWVLSNTGASDGSQTPKAVLLTPALAASGAVKAIALVREAKVNRNALIFHASIANLAARNTAVAALRTVGIIAD